MDILDYILEQQRLNEIKRQQDLAQQEVILQSQRSQQNQQQGVGMPPGGMSVAQNYMGGGAEGTSLTSAAPLAAIIAAAIAIQHGLSRKTSTEFEGQPTGDAFSGDFGTEPWLGYAYDKLGFDPTAGQKFDAAIKNRDWETALRRTPDMLSYWTEPGSHVAYDVVKEKAGSNIANILNPMRWLFGKIAG